MHNRFCWSLALVKSKLGRISSGRLGHLSYWRASGQLDLEMNNNGTVSTNTPWKIVDSHEQPREYHEIVMSSSTFHFDYESLRIHHRFRRISFIWPTTELIVHDNSGIVGTFDGGDLEQLWWNFYVYSSENSTKDIIILENVALHKLFPRLVWTKW